MPIPTHMITCPLCHQVGLALEMIEQLDSLATQDCYRPVPEGTHSQYLVGARCLNIDCENECGPSQLSDLAEELGYTLAKRPDMDRYADLAQKELDYWLS